MGNLQYIGARYVPKFFENPDTNDMEWKSGVGYEPLTVVKYNDDTYTSKIPVPSDIGDPESNPTYWAKTADYNAALQSLQESVNDLSDEIDLKTSPAYLKDNIVNIPINRWYSDNDEVENLDLDPLNVTFNLRDKSCLNYGSFLELKKWTPFDDSLISISNQGNMSHKYTKDGIVFSATANGASFYSDWCLRSRKYEMLEFEVGADDSITTDSKVGVVLGQRMYLMYRFDNHSIYYEIPALSTGTVRISNDIDFTGATKVRILLCFDSDSSIYVHAAADDDVYEYVGKVTEPNGVAITNSVGVYSVLRTNATSTYVKNMRIGFTALYVKDTRYIHYDNAEPYIVNNKAYFTADCGVYDYEFAGIFRHTLDQSDYELVGVLSFDGVLATNGPDLMFDRESKKWRGLIVKFTNPGQDIYYFEGDANNLEGVINFDTTMLPTVSDHTDFGTNNNNEDPCMCHYKGKWYIAINRMSDDFSPDYYYDIFVSDQDEFDLNTFTYHGSYLASSLTGASFMAFGGNLYLVSGNATTIGVFDVVDKVFKGSFVITTDNRVWGNVIAVTRGAKTKLYLTTFDRHGYTSGTWSYGNIARYDTAEFNNVYNTNTYGTR